MRCLTRFARPAVMFAALLLLPALALAQNKERSVELGLMYTFTHFDSQTGLAFKTSPTILVGYNHTKRHGLELMFNSMTATPRTGDSFLVDIDTLRLGYTFNAYPKPKVVSCFRIGAGVWVIAPESHVGGPDRLEDGDSNLLVYTGGAFRWYFHPRVGIRMGASIDFIDAGQGFTHPDVQATGDFGVVFLMGGREETEKSSETP